MPTLETAQAWYPAEDPVHGFDHVIRVYRMAERLAESEGADLEIVRAAVLLHDAEGSATEGGDQGRAGHHHASASFARQVLAGEGWTDERIAAVQHCILAHRFRDPSESPATLEAKILFDADKLDVLGAIGVARALAYAVVVGQPFYAAPSTRFLETGEKEAGEAHSAYHEWLFKLSKIRDRLYTQEARRLAAGRYQYLAEFFERLGAELQGEI